MLFEGKVDKPTLPRLSLTIMKALITALVLCLALTSCSTGDGSVMSSEEEAQAMAMLLHSERNALIATESEAFSSLDSFAVPSSWAPYSGLIPQLDAAIESYLEAVRLVLRSACGDVTDHLFSVLDTLDLSPVQSYYEGGYSSVTDSLVQSEADRVEEIFLSAIDSNRQALDSAYATLDREARIWAENQANLLAVGQGSQIPPLTPLEDGDIAHYATLAWFELLSQNEIVQRGSLQTGGAA